MVIVPSGRNALAGSAATNGPAVGPILEDRCGCCTVNGGVSHPHGIVKVPLKVNVIGHSVSGGTVVKLCILRVKTILFGAKAAGSAICRRCTSCPASMSSSSLAGSVRMVSPGSEHALSTTPVTAPIGYSLQLVLSPWALRAVTL